MHLKIIDELIESDRVFGPMPDFSSTFEAYFIERAYNLLFDTYPSSECQFISLSDENDDLKWMSKVELAKNSREQNLEIVYNNNRVYFKTCRPIRKHESLATFPSKDLEISLGLQFVPTSSDGKYICKKCSQIVDHQYGLMLHLRYFCSQSTNSLLKSVRSSGLEVTPKPNVAKRKQAHLEAINPNELISNKKARLGPPELDYRTMVYQNYLRLLQQHQQPVVINQARLREQFANQLLAYLEASQSLSPPQPHVSSPEASVYGNCGSGGVPSPVSPGLVVKPNMPELNQLISNQSIQNWCAKCNTFFRLTSDLVHHMRTYHRKDGRAEVNFKSGPFDSPALFVNGPVDKALSNSGKELSQALKCEICNEVFKEKHHLSRHMTSHR